MLCVYKYPSLCIFLLVMWSKNIILVFLFLQISLECHEVPNPQGFLISPQSWWYKATCFYDFTQQKRFLCTSWIKISTATPPRAPPQILDQPLQMHKLVKLTVVARCLQINTLHAWLVPVLGFSIRHIKGWKYNSRLHIQQSATNSWFSSVNA